MRNSSLALHPELAFLKKQRLDAIDENLSGHIRLNLPQGTYLFQSTGNKIKCTGIKQHKNQASCGLFKWIWLLCPAELPHQIVGEQRISESATN